MRKKHTQQDVCYLDTSPLSTRYGENVFGAPVSFIYFKHNARFVYCVNVLPLIPGLQGVQVDMFTKWTPEPFFSPKQTLND